jgi:hypothetical protein
VVTNYGDSSSEQGHNQEGTVIEYTLLSSGHGKGQQPRPNGNSVCRHIEISSVHCCQDRAIFITVCCVWLLQNAMSHVDLVLPETSASNVLPSRRDDGQVFTQIPPRLVRSVLLILPGQFACRQGVWQGNLLTTTAVSCSSVFSLQGPRAS